MKKINNNWEKYNNQILIFLLIVWIVIFIFLAIRSLLHWGASIDWTSVTGLATWVVAGGVGSAIWQIRQAKKSTDAQIAMDLFNELRNRDAIETLRYIYNLPSEDKLGWLLDSNKHRIDYLLDRFDALAVLLQQGIVDEKLAIEAYAGFPVVRVWYQLHNYILEENISRGWYMGNFEPFARKCLDYFRENGITVKLTKGNQISPINVTEEMWKEGIRPRTTKEINSHGNLVEIIPTIEYSIKTAADKIIEQIDIGLKTDPGSSELKNKKRTIELLLKSRKLSKWIERSNKLINQDKMIIFTISQKNHNLQHKMTAK